MWSLWALEHLQAQHCKCWAKIRDEITLVLNRRVQCAGIYLFIYFKSNFISAAGHRPMSDNTCAKSATQKRLDLGHGHVHRCEKICKGEDR